MLSGAPERVRGERNRRLLDHIDERTQRHTDDGAQTSSTTTTTIEPAIVPTEASDRFSEAYVHGCALSPSGRDLAFVKEQYDDNNNHLPWTVQLWNLTSGSEVAGDRPVPGSDCTAAF